MVENVNAPANDDAGQQVENEERSRDRSPSFPFISLKNAVERAKTFEAVHRRYAARLTVAADLWKMSAKSSGMLQTVAALKAYGLMKDSGSGNDRKIELTDLAQRILKDERPGNKQEALKQAALKPRLIADHWKKWGAERPPDATCLSDLHLDQKFTQDAAARFLRVYDATIRYAGLTVADNAADDAAEIEEPQAPQAADSGSRPPPDAASGAASTGTRFAAGGAGVRGGLPQVNERVVFSQEIETPQHLLKVLVTGPVDEALLDALDDFVGFQRKRLERRAKSASKDSAKAEEDAANQVHLKTNCGEI